MSAEFLHKMMQNASDIDQFNIAMREVAKTINIRIVYDGCEISGSSYEFPNWARAVHLSGLKCSVDRIVMGNSCVDFNSMSDLGSADKPVIIDCSRLGSEAEKHVIDSFMFTGATENQSAFSFSDAECVSFNVVIVSSENIAKEIDFDGLEVAPMLSIQGTGEGKEVKVDLTNPESQLNIDARGFKGVLILKIPSMSVDLPGSTDSASDSVSGKEFADWCALNPSVFGCIELSDEARVKFMVSSRAVKAARG